MKLFDVIEKLKEIESKFPVENWKIENIHVWPIIKFEIYSRVFYRDNPLPRENNIHLRKIKKFFNFFYSFFRDWKHNIFFLRKFDYVFLNISTTRFFQIKNKWYEVYSDGLIDIFKGKNKNFLLLERINNINYKIPRYRKSKYIQLMLDFFYFSEKHNKKKMEYLKFDNFNEFIEVLKSENLLFSLIDFKSLEYKVRVLLKISKYFKKILKKSEAKVGLVICYYNLVGMAFALACKESGIDCIDVQHGVQGEYHRAYSNWVKVPEGGYELLPSRFGVWTEYELEVINKNKDLIKYHKPFVLNDVRIQSFLYSNTEITKYFDNKLMKIRKKNKKKKNIIITLQPIFEMNDIFFKVIKDAGNDFYWWIRFHPSACNNKEKINKRLKKQNIDNFNIEEATTYPLYSLLNFVDIHLTLYSSSVLEAEKFNVKSIICHEYGKEIYDYFIKEEKAYYSTDTNRIVSLINKIKKEQSIKKSNNFFSKEICEIFKLKGN